MATELITQSQQRGSYLVQCVQQVEPWSSQKWNFWVLRCWDGVWVSCLRLRGGGRQERGLGTGFTMIGSSHYSPGCAATVPHWCSSVVQSCNKMRFDIDIVTTLNSFLDCSLSLTPVPGQIFARGAGLTVAVRRVQRQAGYCTAGHCCQQVWAWLVPP